MKRDGNKVYFEEEDAALFKTLERSCWDIKTIDSLRPSPQTSDEIMNILDLTYGKRKRHSQIWQEVLGKCVELGFIDNISVEIGLHHEWKCLKIQ